MNIDSIPDGVKICTVSELTGQIKSLLEGEFASVWVSGEVSNLSRPRSGHLYFSLKDTQAQLRSVIWRGIALRLRFELKDGLEVFARGRVTVYEPRGDYQFIIEEIQPKGLGALELALRQLREKLFALGYFDPKRKKRLPRIPRRIALVTSPTGAAVRDMLEILGRRWPAAEVWVCPVAVQGEGAGQDIAAMIRRLNTLQPSVDVLIVGRGGGTLEDLWPFNEEVVAQAIFDSRIPVVSAVGHEVDLTISDLVADRRALTPSEGAEIVVPNREEMLEQFFGSETRLKELLLYRLDAARQRWQALAQHRAFRLPLERVHESERRVDDWADRLHRAALRRVQHGRREVEALAGQLEGLSPLNVLARGYSLTRREKDGSLVKNPEQVEAGERIETLLQQGRIISRVEEHHAPGERSRVSAPSTS
jgi:exodeoxyribonuclease VII large subunit